MFDFFLNNHPAILFGLVVLFNVLSFVVSQRKKLTTDEDDFKLIQAFAYLQAHRSKGSKYPRSFYGQWSKHTIKD